MTDENYDRRYFNQGIEQIEGWSMNDDTTANGLYGWSVVGLYFTDQCGVWSVKLKQKL